MMDISSCCLHVQYNNTTHIFSGPNRELDEPISTNKACNPPRSCHENPPDDKNLPNDENLPKDDDRPFCDGDEVKCSNDDICDIDEPTTTTLRPLRYLTILKSQAPI